MLFVIDNSRSKWDFSINVQRVIQLAFPDLHFIILDGQCSIHVENGLILLNIQRDFRFLNLLNTLLPERAHVIWLVIRNAHFYFTSEQPKRFKLWS